MFECMTLTDSDRLCTTLCPESVSLVQSRSESDTRSLDQKMSETGNPTLRLKPSNRSDEAGKDPLHERTVPARVGGTDAVADLRRSAMNRLKSLNSHTALHSGSALCNGFAFYLKPSSTRNIK